MAKPPVLKVGDTILVITFSGHLVSAEVRSLGRRRFGYRNKGDIGSSYVGGRMPFSHHGEEWLLFDSPEARGLLTAQALA